MVEGSLEAYWEVEYAQIKIFDFFPDFWGLGPNFHIWAFWKKCQKLNNF